MTTSKNINQNMLIYSSVKQGSLNINKPLVKTYNSREVVQALKLKKNIKLDRKNNFSMSPIKKQ